MIAMRALKTFRGRPDEGIHGKVRIGREFEAGTERRAIALEQGGLAIRLAPPEQPQAPLVNEAAIRGPLSIAGGETGGDKALSSSPAVRVPTTPILAPFASAPVSSASTNPGGSRRGRMRSTDATEHGGGCDGRDRSLLV